MRELPWWLGNASVVGHPWMGGFLLLVLWSVVWTGLSLWHSARRGEKVWFVIFLLVHTAGVLEIVYLVFVARIFEAAKKKRRT